MPIYEYRCKSCETVYEELVTGDRDKKIPCPSCGSRESEKIMSVIGGIAMGKSSSGPACGSTSCASASACAASGGGCCPHAG
jgi:putative FmdB family regulatory protein